MWVSRSLNEDDDSDLVLYKELREIFISVALVTVGNFNFLDVNWDYHKADTNRSCEFVKHIADGF